jgi:hypothetical protein
MAKEMVEMPNNKKQWKHFDCDKSLPITKHKNEIFD